MSAASARIQRITDGRIRARDLARRRGPRSTETAPRGEKSAPLPAEEAEGAEELQEEPTQAREPTPRVAAARCDSPSSSAAPRRSSAEIGGSRPCHPAR